MRENIYNTQLEKDEPALNQHIFRHVIVSRVRRQASRRLHHITHLIAGNQGLIFRLIWCASTKRIYQPAYNMPRIPAHISRNPRSGILYFRLAVPARLRSILGKREILKSLGTGRISEAVPLAMAHYLAALELFTQTEGNANMPKLSYSAPALERRKLIDDPHEPIPDHEEFVFELPSGKSIVISPWENADIYRIFIAAAKGQNHLAPADIAPLLRKLTFHPPGGGSVIFEGLPPEEHREVLDAIMGWMKDHTARSAAVPSLPPEPHTAAPVAAKSMKLSKLVKQYFQEINLRERQRPKTQDENRAIFDLLIEVIGDMPISNINREDAHKFLATIKELPANRNKMKASRGQTIAQQRKLTRDGRLPPMAASNVNKYLRRIVALFNWAIRTKHISANPFADLSVKDDTPAYKQRHVFTHEELRILLSPDNLNARTGRHSYCYWLPWLGAFTGCRIDELCQLHLEDIRKEKGVWVFDINNKPPRKLKPGDGGPRLIPIHSRLIALGLLKHVEKMKSRGETRLFPELEQGRDGFMKNASGWFRRYRLRLGIGGTDRKKCFHSFRHTVTNELKQRGVGQLEIKAIDGHTDTDITTGRYGEPYEPKVLKPIIEMLNYDLPF